MTDADRERIDEAMLALLAATRIGATICPSQVARRLERDEAAWRALMPAVRDHARALAQDGMIEVTQRGEVLSPHDPWRGAIRLRQRAGRKPAGSI